MLDTENYIKKQYISVLDEIDLHIINSRSYFIFFTDLHEYKNYSGWKYTIIGKNVDDAVYLSTNLGYYLVENDVEFKIGTQRLINHNDGEQQYKLMTIYINNGTDLIKLDSKIKEVLKDYKGHEGIGLKYSEHIEGALYKRVDVNEDGEYVDAKTAYENKMN